jgi:hypothetical protein
MPGINFRKRKNLKTREILSTSKKLKCVSSESKRKEKIEGIEINIIPKSNLFQFDEIYPFQPKYFSFTMTSIINRKEIIESK